METECMFMDGCPIRTKRQVEDFMPIFADQLSFTEEQIDICNSDSVCLLNVAVTNDVELASTVLEDETMSNTTVDILGTVNKYCQQTFKHIFWDISVMVFIGIFRCFCS